jgi:hypothetical protein
MSEVTHVERGASLESGRLPLQASNWLLATGYWKLATG